MSWTINGFITQAWRKGLAEHVTFLFFLKSKNQKDASITE